MLSCISQDLRMLKKIKNMQMLFLDGTWIVQSLGQKLREGASFFSKTEVELYVHFILSFNKEGGVNGL